MATVPYLEFLKFRVFLIYRYRGGSPSAVLA